MNHGPQSLLLSLDYETRRENLHRQFPEWFSNDLLSFNVSGFIEWATQHSMAERNHWLRVLDVHEVAKVIATYQLWSNMTRHAQLNSPETIHHWLTQVLPFWFSDGQFDHIGYTAWYDCANCMDKEITFKYLKPAEQKAVLKARAAQPLRTLTPLYTLEETREHTTTEPAPQRVIRNRLD